MTLATPATPASCFKLTSQRKRRILRGKTCDAKALPSRPHHQPSICLPACFDVFVCRTHISMHTQRRELAALAPPLYHSSPCLVTLPSPSTVQSSQALGTAWGEQHVWLPGTPKQQQPTPYTHSIYRKHYQAHTQHRIIPFASRIPWIFLLADRLRRQNHDVLWLAFRLV